MNHFYVYLHKLKDTGEVFYIGKGTKNRKDISSGRSKDWNDRVENKEWFSEIYAENLTASEAEKLETELIHKHRLTVCNIRGKFQKIIFTFDEINNLLSYSEDSPSGLVWKKNNKPAGWKCRKGFLVEIKGKAIGAHRIIYLLFNGELNFNNPVDHIDGNPFNNSPSNLRNVSISINNKNRVMAEEPLVSRYTTIDSSGWVLTYRTPEKRVKRTFTDIKSGGADEAKRLCIEYKYSIKEYLLSLGYTERIFKDDQFARGN